MAANCQPVAVAPAHAGKSLSAVIEAVWRAVAFNVFKKRTELMPPVGSGGPSIASVTPIAKFSKRPHDKIGFSFAWVCECGSFAAQRSAVQGQEGEHQRQCRACGATERLAYVRLLCEPKVDTSWARGKWVYPEVVVEPSEPGGPSRRDYDWSHYDVLYFQDDRDPDVPACQLAKRA